jgi:hypothetical protein
MLLDEHGNPISDGSPEGEMQAVMLRLTRELEAAVFADRPASGTLLDADGRILPPPEPTNDLERARRKKVLAAFALYAGYNW